MIGNMTRHIVIFLIHLHLRINIHLLLMNTYDHLILR